MKSPEHTKQPSGGLSFTAYPEFKMVYENWGGTYPPHFLAGFRMNDIVVLIVYYDMTARTYAFVCNKEVTDYRKVVTGLKDPRNVHFSFTQKCFTIDVEGHNRDKMIDRVQEVLAELKWE